jgi:hypothetical protein
VEDLIETISAYGELRREEFLSYISELSSRSGAVWNSDDQRLGGLLTERSLEALGHIDVSFDHSPARVFATPRLLVARPFTHGEPTAFLVGERTRNVVATLLELDSRDTVSVSSRASGKGLPCVPDRIQITASSHEEMKEIASLVQAQYIQDPPARTLLAFSSTLKEYLQSLDWQNEPDLNWAKRVFDIEALSFRATSQSRRIQLTEFKQRPLWPATYRIRDGAKTCEVHRDWGRYAALASAGKNVLGFFDFAPQTRVGHLVTPIGALLPRLFARAASLCSGRPPVFMRKDSVKMESGERLGFLVYADVNRDIAELIADKLGQRLKDATLTDAGDINA